MSKVISKDVKVLLMKRKNENGGGGKKEKNYNFCTPSFCRDFTSYVINTPVAVGERGERRLFLHRSMAFCFPIAGW